MYVYILVAANINASYQLVKALIKKEPLPSKHVALAIICNSLYIAMDI